MSYDYYDKHGKGYYYDSNDDTDENNQKVKTKDKKDFNKDDIVVKIKNLEEHLYCLKQLTICKNNVQIKNKVIQLVIKHYINEIIIHYQKYEFLPLEYINLAKEKNCLDTLLKSFLKNELKISLSKLIIDEIEVLLKILYESDKIVYDRVSMLQKFIHNKTNEINGINAFLALDAIKMRQLLSTARLHLNIYDLTNSDYNDLAKIIEQSNYINYQNVPRMKNQVTYKGSLKKRKDIKNMDSIIVFFQPCLDVIQEIKDIDETNISIDTFRETIIKKYVYTFGYTELMTEEV